MNQDKDFKVELRREKEKKAKAPFYRYVRLGFMGLSLHLSGLGTGIELCWLALPIAEKKFFAKALSNYLGMIDSSFSNFNF